MVSVQLLVPKWVLAAHEEVGEDAHAPDIDLLAVVSLLNDLRGPKQWSYNVIVLLLVMNITKPKIRDFNFQGIVIEDQYVLWFDVVVDNAPKMHCV